MAEARQGDLAGISAAFAASLEYRTTFAGMTCDAIVGTIYQNLFGRAPERAGTSYWAELLGTGKLHIDTIVMQIADGARLSDKTAFANKVSAATAFTAALDTPEEVAAYARTDAGPAARAFLSAVTSDASLASAIAPAALQATIENIVFSHTTSLSTVKDNIMTSPGHTVFVAPLLAGQATLQSGDMVFAGFGTIDTLRADLLTDRIESVSPLLAQVDRVELHVVAGSPNMAALLDASKIKSTTHYVSDRSEADLLIQNVGLTDTGINEVKVEMRDTAGDADLGVYFERASLSDAPASGSILRLHLLDTRSVASTGIPLLDNPYDRVTFQFNGKPVTVQSARIDTAVNYDELLQAIGAAVAATPGLDNVRVQLGASFTAVDTLGILQRGTEIVLYSVGNDTFGSEDAHFGTGGWLLFGTPYSRILASSQPPLASVASSIILDGVGRGAQGGDLLVGSMRAGGVGEGVARFDIEVRNSSSLQTIGSTNNALRDVTIHNGYASKEADIGKGSLAVLGGGTDIPLPNAAPSASGFTDVRTIDASAMQGGLRFTAAITTASLDKYALPAGSAATNPFVYTGGTGNDHLQIAIAADVLAAKAFMLVLEGGAGDDRLSVDVTNGAGGAMSGQAQQNKLMVSAGSGNDVLVVSGAAGFIVELGAGDDRIALSTSIDPGGANAGNDTLIYGADPFGNDFVAGFKPGSAALGGDRIDFSALGGRGSAFAGTATSSTDKSITVQQQSTANETAAQIAALYLDSSAGASHVFIAVDSTNVGKVYAVTDSAMAAVTATLVGTIDLSATPWTGLSGANFV